MRRAVVYVSGEPHYHTPEFWWHLRLQKHPTNFATNRVDQLLSTSILELLMLVGVQLFFHIVLYEHFTQLLCMIFSLSLSLSFSLSFFLSLSLQFSRSLDCSSFSLCFFFPLFPFCSFTFFLALSLFLFLSCILALSLFVFSRTASLAVARSLSSSLAFERACALSLYIHLLLSFLLFFFLSLSYFRTSALPVSRVRTLSLSIYSHMYDSLFCSRSCSYSCSSSFSLSLIFAATGEFLFILLSFLSAYHTHHNLQILPGPRSPILQILS